MLCSLRRSTAAVQALIGHSNSTNSTNSITMGDRYGGGGDNYGGGGYGECCLPVPSCSQRIPSAARARRRARGRRTASGFAPEAAASQERLLLPACRAFSRSRERLLHGKTAQTTRVLTLSSLAGGGGGGYGGGQYLSLIHI